MDARGVIRSVFGAPRALVGVVHTAASRHAGRARGESTRSPRTRRRGTRVHAAGFHGLMIENMHDRPYLKGAVGPEIVAAIAVIGREVRSAAAARRPGAGRRESAALAVAHACGASFVRVEGFVFAHVADEGIIESCAGAAALPSRDRRRGACASSPTSRRSIRRTPSRPT